MIDTKFPTRGSKTSFCTILGCLLPFSWVKKNELSPLYYLHFLSIFLNYFIISNYF